MLLCSPSCSNRAPARRASNPRIARVASYRTSRTAAVGVPCRAETSDSARPAIRSTDSARRRGRCSPPPWPCAVVDCKRAAGRQHCARRDQHRAASRHNGREARRRPSRVGWSCPSPTSVLKLPGRFCASTAIGGPHHKQPGPCAPSPKKIFLFRVVRGAPFLDKFHRPFFRSGCGGREPRPQPWRPGGDDVSELDSCSI